MKSINGYRDTTNEDELAKLERELQNKVFGLQTETLASKIEERRLKSESVENNLEAEEYTRQVLDLVEEFQKPKTTEVEDKPAAAHSYTPEELKRLAAESSQAFAPKASPTFAQVKKPHSEELDRTVALDPRKVGAEALMKDIAKSELSSSQGIRDFYHHVYSKHGETRLREKEAYLNLTHTGNVAAAREQLDQYADTNRFNTGALEHLNDGLVSAMHDLHKEELANTPTGEARETLERRHEVEKALFHYRENTDKHGQDNHPTAQQEHKDAYRDLQKAHIAYAENRWGRQLAHKDVPSVNDEVDKFDMKAASKQANTTDLQQYMAAKSKLGLKIGKFR